MRKPFEDLSGQRFGRLTVYRRLDSKVYGNRTKAAYAVTCDCGNVREVMAQNLRNGRTTSCGCWRKEVPAILAQPIETMTQWKQERDRLIAGIEELQRQLTSKQTRLDELLGMIA